MDKFLLKALSEVKINIKTPFRILDENNVKIFGDDLGKFPNNTPFNLFFRNWGLEANIPKEYLSDFCFLLKSMVVKVLRDKLEAFMQGKDIDFEFLPYPVGLILIKSHRLSEIELFLWGVFSDACIFPFEDTLVVMIPIDDVGELRETTTALYQTISEEITQRAVLSLGGIVNSQQELVGIYEDAKKALKFFSKHGIISYREMTLQRLFSLVPKPSLYAFKNSMDMDFKDLDNDTLNTIRVVLDCNLRLSEAARKLYIHRNTLMYRLDKIVSLTGLDLRDFKDAVKMEVYLTLTEFF